MKRMLIYLYVYAICTSDYQDTALICLLWYLFGRAFDLALLRKQNVSINASKLLFVRFIRMKNRDSPDSDITTCLVLAVALTGTYQKASKKPYAVVWSLAAARKIPYCRRKMKGTWIQIIVKEISRLYCARRISMMYGTKTWS